MTKNKSLTYLVLCALLMLISCSEAIVTLPEEEQKAAEAVAFSAYLNRTTSSVSTRAGQNGAIGNEALKGSTVGFGVFAFLGNDDWLYASNTQQPDFMYNQQVTWNGSTAWTYSPLKYWPNETGGDATSVSTDRLSFFAYAPYVAVTPETGQLTSHYTGAERTTGITAMSHYHHQGDPWVQYVVSYDAASQVDLCWANVDGNTLDQTKHSINDPVQLNFHHALSALNVQIDATMDALSPSGSAVLNGNTCIYMRSVTFEGFSASGALNLYNRVAGKPRWIGNYGQGLIDMEAVTIYDGRRDRHEGSGANANEWPTGLNADLVQSGPYSVSGSSISSIPPLGVTETAVNLFTPPTIGTPDDKLMAPIFVIPNGQPLRVTVAYDVETYDPSLKYQRLSDDQTFGSSVPNVISSWVRLGDDNLVLEAGKQYTLKLHLGMTSVKVDVVSVKAWEDGAIVDVTIPDEP